ncbi:MAG: hypothetical protein FJX65_04935 [Alphaproteobacteria bacterium]|nr:hypothetical protein [Alphaproteobacteria bacterium]
MRCDVPDAKHAIFFVSPQWRRSYDPERPRERTWQVIGWIDDIGDTLCQGLLDETYLTDYPVYCEKMIADDDYRLYLKALGNRGPSDHGPTLTGTTDVAIVQPHDARPPRLKKVDEDRLAEKPGSIIYQRYIDPRRYLGR